MALSVPFSQNQAFSAKYWYERLQYTWGPQTLNTGNTPVFNVSKLNSTQVPQWVAELSGIAATQNANVFLDIAFDRNSIPALVNQGATDALPSGVRSYSGLLVRATRNMSLQMQNLGFSSIDNFQLNYQVAMRRLTVADKILLGISQFTQDEQDALRNKSIDIEGLVSRGAIPIPIETQIERTYRNRLIYSEERLLHVDADLSDTSFLTIRASETGGDSFLVLRHIAIEGGASVVVSVDRDEDSNYMGVNGAAFVDADDRPWDVFVPALRYLTFHIQANSIIQGVPIRIVVWHVKLSDILRIRFGLVGRGQVPDDLYLRVIAGVV